MVFSDVLTTLVSFPSQRRTPFCRKLRAFRHEPYSYLADADMKHALSSATRHKSSRRARRPTSELWRRRKKAKTPPRWSSLWASLSDVTTLEVITTMRSDAAAGLLLTVIYLAYGISGPPGYRKRPGRIHEYFKTS